VSAGERFDVIVVGGGLAGLAAGATAAHAGAAVVVLEAHEPGGRARTSERDGFVLNLGVHAQFLGGAGATVLQSLGIGLTGAAPPMDRYRMLAGGEAHVLPIGPESLQRTTFLGDADKRQLEALVGRLGELDPAGLGGESVGGWLARQDLRPRAERVVRALFRLSTYAADLDELAADAGIAQQQIAARSGVRYLDGGWAQMIDALRAETPVRSGAGVRTVFGDPRGAVVETHDGELRAGAVVVAAGTPAAARRVLPGDPGWGDLGEPVTAACLDVGVRRVPSPGYLVGVDEPIYGTTQSPPARQAPDGSAVVAAIRYGARSAREDRPALEEHLRLVGVHDDDVVVERFLARMVVSGAMPRAASGGLRGRPSITATGMPRVFLAGDWVGPRGLLSDAALASGHAAARAALRVHEQSTAA
jgi:phytoene dehydrogenase-like protein